MRSKAHFLKGHPVHPALVPFPIAFLIGAFAFDLYGRVTGRESWVLGAYLAIAGVVAGVIVALPGFVDYFYTVPPRSSGRRTATRHMLANLSAVLLFAVAWWIRGGAALPPGPGVLVLEAVGVALLVYGGWLGGTLVYRNQIGVDHRYAGAGKWKEETVIGRAGESVVVARADELATSQMKLIRSGDRRIVLARTEEGYVAFDDHCTHRGGSLAGGAMICGRVQCPWHGSQFDVRTGGVVAGPAKEPIPTYRVEERNGEVRLLLP
jgi:uncharacterized membrane protein/nitrite reductase/ring-hydroxylating ferredoxin subunit